MLVTEVRQEELKREYWMGKLNNGVIHTETDLFHEILNNIYGLCVDIGKTIIYDNKKSGNAIIYKAKINCFLIQKDVSTTTLCKFATYLLTL